MTQCRFCLLCLSVFFTEFGFSDLYVESWKKGPTRVKEQALKYVVMCEPGKGTVERVIEDEAGNARYKLVVRPADGELDDCDENGNLGWIVYLFPIGLEYRGTLLKPTNDPYQDCSTAVDNAGLFAVGWEDVSAEDDPTEDYPGTFERRIIRVESFYCILKATDVAYAPTGLYRSIALEIKFSNNCEGCDTGR